MKLPKFSNIIKFKKRSKKADSVKPDVSTTDEQTFEAKPGRKSRIRVKKKYIIIFSVLIILILVGTVLKFIYLPIPVLPEKYVNEISLSEKINLVYEYPRIYSKDRIKVLINNKPYYSNYNDTENEGEKWYFDFDTNMFDEGENRIQIFYAIDLFFFELVSKEVVEKVVAVDRIPPEITVEFSNEDDYLLLENAKFKVETEIGARVKILDKTFDFTGSEDEEGAIQPMQMFEVLAPTGKVDIKISATDDFDNSKDFDKNFSFLAFSEAGYSKYSCGTIHFPLSDNLQLGIHSVMGGNSLDAYFGNGYTQNTINDMNNNWHMRCDNEGVSLTIVPKGTEYYCLNCGASVGYISLSNDTQNFTPNESRLGEANSESGVQGYWNRELIDLTDAPGDYGGVRFEWDSYNFKNVVDGKWYRFDIDMVAQDPNKARDDMGLMVKYLEVE